MRNKVISLILAIGALTTLSFGGRQAFAYDSSAAVDYAEQWWNGRNPNYNDYSESGGDCANFVSQCLIAGGLDLTVCDTCTWIDSKGCLPRCRDLHTYLVDYLHLTWETRPKGQVEPLWFLPGDPAIFGYSDAHPRTHAVFAVTGDASHYATCNAHSDNAHHVSISQFYTANPSFDRCTYYHISTVYNYLQVPYIHQCWDTPEDFDGRWACSATSSVMVLVYYGILDPWPCDCSQPYPHTSDYGNYISKIYTFDGYTFDDMSTDTSGNPAYGAFGYIYHPGSIKEKMVDYFILHGLDSEIDYSPTEAEVKAEIDAGYPVVALTWLTDEGHYVVIKGYTDDGRYIVNDPYGSKPYGDGICGNYNGADVQYTWSEMRVGERKMILAHGTVPINNYPSVDYFNVTPDSVTLGNSFTISYTVSDDIGLNRVELWRAVDENGDGEPNWPDDPEGYIDIRYLSGKTIDSNSFSDTPSVADTYWYGLHVVDNAEQLSFEPDPPGPMERTVTTDTTPPSPDPMTWLSEPYQTSTSSISMVATTASDESTPISYYFDFYSSPTGGSGGTDSGWQTSPTYSDSDLQVNHKYGYRVKARDSVGNETAYSSTSYEYTDAKVPGTASFSDVTGSSIQVNWTANGNPSWTEYFCENVTNGTNSGWTTSTHWDDTELISETEYCYQVKTRNGDGEETGWTNLGCETTLASKIPLMDLNHDGMMNLGDFAIFGFFWMNDTCCDPNWCEGSDSDQSGMVNFLDLSNFVDDWLWQYWTVIQLTDNSEFDLEHDVSGSSIVWMGGGISEDYEIFLYNGTKTSQVTNNGYDDVFPGVSGTNIAWLGQVDADGEIFLFDGTTTTRLTDNSYQEGVPRVSGSHVVWEGYDGNDDEIFLYDGTSLTQLTDNSYADEVPRVSGSNVVWRGRCDPTLRGEIFLYDGTSTTQLTNDTNFDLDPDVSGSNVVWASKDITSEYEIFLYDGTDTIQLTNNTYRDFDPHVSGYNVVWKALIGGDWEIFFYDGTTTIQLTDNSSDDEHPRVSGSIVVWHGWDGNDKEIFIYDGTSTIQLTDNNYDDEEPEVSGSTIVWRGWDGNDWEIFMAIPTDTIF